MRKIIAKSIFATTITVAAAINLVALTACVVDTDDTYDIEPVPAEELTTESAVTELDEVDTEIAPEPELIVVPETVINVSPGKVGPARILEVGVDHSAVEIKILNADGNLVALMAAKDCPKDDRDEYYRICSFELDAEAYTVRFGGATGYETPDDVDVNLKWGGTEVYGSYAEDFDAPKPRQADVRLPGIGDQLAF